MTVLAEAAAPSPVPGPPPQRVRGGPDLLVSPMPTDRWQGWLVTALLTAVAGIVRIVGVGRPATDVFDEIYYHWEAIGLLRYGVEQEKPAILNPALVKPDFVVHPPLGKWMIAAGIQLFGNTPFGWRIASVVAGTVAVAVMVRLARRMFRSTLLGGLAGLLFSLDGMEFVQSRVAMLDIFYLLFVVAGLACLVADRDDGRRRLAARLAAGDPVDWPGPRLGVRPWRLATGFFLGCLCATKWDGVFVLPAYAALALAWDVGARRSAGVPAPVRATLRRDWSWWVPSYLLVPTAVYTVSWTGWFLATSRDAYDRHLHGRSGLIGTVLNWASFHRAGYKYATNLTNNAHCLAGRLDAAGTGCVGGIGVFYPAVHHPYESKPFGWLVLARPVAYFYKSLKDGQAGCHAVGGCSREILLIGTPALWWVGTIALLATALIWAATRDWRAGLVLVGFGFCFLPWLPFITRVMFEFYILPGLPFLVLALTLVAGWAMRGRWRTAGTVAVAVYTLLVIANFVYLYPILTGATIPYRDWLSHMWFPGWI